MLSDARSDRMLQESRAAGGQGAEAVFTTTRGGAIGCRESQAVYSAESNVNLVDASPSPLGGNDTDEDEDDDDEEDAFIITPGNDTLALLNHTIGAVTWAPLPSPPPSSTQLQVADFPCASVRSAIAQLKNGEHEA